MTSGHACLFVFTPRGGARFCFDLWWRKNEFILLYWSWSCGCGLGQDSAGLWVAVELHSMATVPLWSSLRNSVPSKRTSQQHMLLIAIFARRSPEKIKLLACICDGQTHPYIFVDRDDPEIIWENSITTPNPQIDSDSLGCN
jgi:hypothetical protein